MSKCTGAHRGTFGLINRQFSTIDRVVEDWVMHMLRPRGPDGCGVEKRSGDHLDGDPRSHAPWTLVRGTCRYSHGTDGTHNCSEEHWVPYNGTKGLEHSWHAPDAVAQGLLPDPWAGSVDTTCTVVALTHQYRGPFRPDPKEHW